MTYEAFAEDVGVTKSAVSLWMSATKPVRIQPGTLRRVAMRTGARLEDLERMAYGETGAEERAPEGRISLSRDELQAMLDQAAEAAVRRVMADREREARDG